MGTLKLVKQWSCNNVRSWLKDTGFAEYADLIAIRHKVDGSVLLQLTEEDLRNPPLSITVLGDIKRLSQAIDCLRTNNCRHDCRLHANRDQLAPHNGQWPADLSPFACPSPECPSDSIFYNSEKVTQNVTVSRLETDDICSPWSCMVKALVAAFYFGCSILITSMIMVIVRDRVPDAKTYPPLPDLLLDNIPRIPWAFYCCEILGCFLALILCIILLFHKHRLILLRRFFSLAGTVFLLRCITMLITSLSVPGLHLQCNAVKNNSWYEKFADAVQIFYGFGMSMLGVRSCGDYMFSGHTSVVTLLNHFITEYTPDTWNYLHTFSWVSNLFAIFFILASHEHYSIDVFIAFYISSRLFLYYHSMAYNAKFVTVADDRLKIWFPLFWFLESGSQSGRIPNEFTWPLPPLSAVCALINGSYFMQKSRTEFELLQSKCRVHIGRVQRFLFHDGHAAGVGKKRAKHRSKAR